MAIDDNTSYELTGYQVKDLAQKIRAKADSTSLASVATSGLYSDLTGAPTIPTVYNGTLTIQQNGTTLGTFSANQSTNETINITGGGGGTPESIILTDMISMHYPGIMQWASSQGLNPTALQSLNFPTGGCVALNDAGTEILPLDYISGLFAQGKTILVKGVFMQYGGVQVQVGHETYNGQVIAADTLTTVNYPFVLSFAHENIIGQYPVLGLRKQATLGQIGGKEYATLAKI